MELTDLNSAKGEARAHTPRITYAGSCARLQAGPGKGSLFQIAQRTRDGFTTAMRRTGALVAGLLIMTSATLHASGDPSPTPAHTNWQISRLMAPTRTQLSAESRGQVFIYDSLDIDQVEKAMDSNFGRIEHMMFIRIHHPPVTGGGQYEVEDDEC